MSKTEQGFDELSLKTNCVFCGAAPGTWCVTKLGRRSQQLHGARTKAAHWIYNQGYRQGRDYATGVMLSQNATWRESLIRTYLWNAHTREAGGCKCGKTWAEPLNGDEELEHEMHLEDVRAGQAR